MTNQNLPGTTLLATRIAEQNPPFGVLGCANPSSDGSGRVAVSVVIHYGRIASVMFTYNDTKHNSVSLNVAGGSRGQCVMRCVAVCRIGIPKRNTIQYNRIL